MDNLDYQILEILQNDASITAKEISAQLSLTTTPIYERMKKLQKNKIIEKYVAVLNPVKLGLQVCVFLNFSVRFHDKESRDKLVKAVLALPDILEFYHTSGTYDFKAKVRFKTLNNYRRFLVDEISTIPNISDIDSQIVLQELKGSSFAPLNLAHIQNS